MEEPGKEEGFDSSPSSLRPAGLQGILHHEQLFIFCPISNLLHSLPPSLRELFPLSAAVVPSARVPSFGSGVQQRKELASFWKRAAEGGERGPVRGSGLRQRDPSGAPLGRNTDQPLPTHNDSPFSLQSGLGSREPQLSYLSCLTSPRNSLLGLHPPISISI